VDHTTARPDLRAVDEAEARRIRDGSPAEGDAWAYGYPFSGVLDRMMFSAEDSGVADREQEARRLFGELWLVINDVTRGVEAELKPFGLTHAQFQVLLHVVSTPDISQRELSERLHVTTGNVSMLVTKLESAGLIDRIPAGAAFQLRVTAAGRRTFDSLGPTRAQFLQETFAHLSTAELSRTADVLRTIRRH
jgi:MarR family 2-MHQ and catechol resistance regulon transcriptional repressor